MSRFATLLKKLCTSGSRGRRARPRAWSFTPRLEALEERQVPSTVFRVTNSLDSGPGSLRQAILDANAMRTGIQASPDKILFSLPIHVTLVHQGPAVIRAVQTTPISVRSALPTITDPVVIDGTNRDGMNNPVLGFAVLDGSLAGPGVDVHGNLLGPAVDGLQIAGGFSTVRALTVRGFSGDGIHVLGNGDDTIGGFTTSDGNVISGNRAAGVRIACTGNIIDANFIGTDATGTVAAGNGTGIVIDHAYSNKIGEPGGPPNVISGNLGDGIDILGSQPLDDGHLHLTIVWNNLIGTDVTGMHPLGNNNGILINGSSSIDIGDTGNPGNTIAFNRGSGVVLMGSNSTGNTVANNRIGVLVNNAFGGNQGHGVFITQQAGNNSIGEGNVIDFNGGSGVFVDAGCNNNAIFSNSIFGNTGPGIHNVPSGLSTAPVIMLGSVQYGTVSFSVQGPPGVASYTIEVFLSSASGANGQSLIQTFFVMTNGGTFSVAGLPLGQFVTATATATGGGTSDFSNSLQL
jgi:hypothetical protein